MTNATIDGDQGSPQPVQWMSLHPKDPAQGTSSAPGEPPSALFATGELTITDWTPQSLDTPDAPEEEGVSRVDPDEIAREAREALISEITASTRAEVEAEAVEAQEELRNSLRGPYLVAAARLDEAIFELSQRVHLDTVDLAILLAGQILNRSITLNRELVIENLTKAIRAAGPLESAVIHCHPDDREAIAEQAPRIAEEVADNPVQIEVRSDPALQLGDCVIRFAEGGVDARLQTELERLAEVVRDLVLQRPRAQEGTE